MKHAATTPCPAPRAAASVRDGGPCADELRCGCGSLLARWIPGGVELKCRRCKRRVILKVGERSAIIS